MGSRNEKELEREKEANRVVESHPALGAAKPLYTGGGRAVYAAFRRHVPDLGLCLGGPTPNTLVVLRILHDGPPGPHGPGLDHRSHGGGRRSHSRRS